MKHRSIGAFVLLAATLFAIPQVAQDIRSLKGAIYEHARGHLLQAFLSFNSEEAAPASRRSARTAPCQGAAKNHSLVAASAKKASPRASAAGTRDESPEPGVLADIVVEEATGAFPLPAIAEFIGEAAEAVSEVAHVKVSAAPRPGAVGARLAAPASAKGVWDSVAGSALINAEWKGSESADLGRLKAQEDILKIELLKDADLEQLINAQRVRRFRIRRGKPAPAPPALGGEVPPLPRQAAEATEAHGASGEASKGPAWAVEKQ